MASWIREFQAFSTGDACTAATLTGSAAKAARPSKGRVPAAAVVARNRRRVQVECIGTPPLWVCASRAAPAVRAAPWPAPDVGSGDALAERLSRRLAQRQEALGVGSGPGRTG